MTDSSSFADAVAAEAARHSASRRLREAGEAEERAFIIAEVSNLAAEVFPVLRQRVDLAVPVVRQVNPTWPQGGWVEVGHVWDLDLLGMRSTGEFTSKLTIRHINVEEWRGGSLPSSARDPFTGKLRLELEGNDAPLAPDSPGFFSTFGVARNGEIGIMDAWGAETYVAARAALASRIGRLMATGSAR